MLRAAIVGTAFLLSSSAISSDDFPRPKIYSIASVRLLATDFNKSAVFYSKVLGLPSNTDRDSCRHNPDPCFAVNPYQHVELSSGSHASGSFLELIAFNTSDVVAMKRYLAARGVRTTELSRTPSGLPFVECRDPEGNRIAFTELSGEDSQVDGPNQVSNRFFHAGFVVKDREKENEFYVKVLGFRLYWAGGFKDDGMDWYELQVPDGDNWIEYMLNIPESADHRELGVQNHFSLGVIHIKDAVSKLRSNGLVGGDGPEIGRDGKWSFDIYDPDATRVEMMEFTPAQKPCCHPYSAPHPQP